MFNRVWFKKQLTNISCVSCVSCYSYNQIEDCICGNQLLQKKIYDWLEKYNKKELNFEKRNNINYKEQYLKIEKYSVMQASNKLRFTILPKMKF